MKKLKGLFERKSSRMFLYGTSFAFIAAGIYFFLNYRNTLIFLPAVGYTIKGYFAKFLEVKYEKAE